MITGRKRFNIYFFCALAALACGCRTTDQDKQVATLRVHLESSEDETDFSKTVSVFREKPVKVTVDRDPFLTEADVASAGVVDVRGGFALQIRFDQQGSWLLEQKTTSNPGKHLAIFSEFGGTNHQARWLAAPIIRRRISDGVLEFTPDATRQECEEIVLGLSNVVKRINEKSKW
ncbi:MAG TPA: hypothetical protein VFM25_08460 [Verrucomicrobiae bacterium]|nr:hypothetical protein [Verrucomicrobiae bacterium]